MFVCTGRDETRGARVTPFLVIVLANAANFRQLQLWLTVVAL